MRFRKTVLAVAIAVAALCAVAGCGAPDGGATADGPQAIKLANVSYDPTRELYAAYNELFAEHCKAETGIDVTISQSHGGSGLQADSVIGGLAADVVTLALAHDITRIEQAGLIDDGWEGEFPQDSSPPMARR